MTKSATLEKGRIEVKSFRVPDERRVFDKGRLELVKLGRATVGKAILEPGWRWSKAVKPIAKTKSCEAPHLQYQLSGTLCIQMDDGTVRECKAGDVCSVPTGHDAWVVGDEPVVLVDFQGMAEYALKSGQGRKS
ncbi:MAG: cupin domain-containing protein [Elusimicrobia bacterium]|nr:cupin domain-containing protein [Elusimicrobiota bacterium]